MLLYFIGGLVGDAWAEIPRSLEARVLHFRYKAESKSYALVGVICGKLEREDEFDSLLGVLARLKAAQESPSKKNDEFVLVVSGVVTDEMRRNEALRTLLENSPEIGLAVYWVEEGLVRIERGRAGENARPGGKLVPLEQLMNWNKPGKNMEDKGAGE